MAYNLTHKEYKDLFLMLTRGKYKVDEEIAAESILKATMTYVDGMCEFKTHLVNVVKTIKIDHWRASSVRPKFSYDNPINKKDEEVGNLLNSYFNRTDEEKEIEKEQLELVYEIIEYVKKVKRQGAKNMDKYTWFEYYYTNYTTIDEMSKIFKKKSNTLKTGIQRVREEIKKYLKKYDKKN